jgi:hypothetical protein
LKVYHYMFWPTWSSSGVETTGQGNCCLLLLLTLLICNSSWCACVSELVGCIVSCCVLCCVSCFQKPLPNMFAELFPSTSCFCWLHNFGFQQIMPHYICVRACGAPMQKSVYWNVTNYFYCFWWLHPFNISTFFDKRPARRADNLTAIYEPNVRKCESLNLSQP